MNVLKEYFMGDRSRWCNGVDEYLILKEGLISSYDVNLLIKQLQQYFGDRLNIGKDIKPMFVYKSYSFFIHVKNYDKQDDIKLNKLLDLFGYYITTGNESSLSYRYNGDVINTITIEPKYPIIINKLLIKNNVEYLYHITPISNLSKIHRYGLAPRGTETTFYHPDDRIYLMYSSNILGIQVMKNMLSEDKTTKFKLEKEATKMVVLKTPFDDKYEYYLDDSVVINIKNTYGCFVLKNIPPDKLELTDI